MKKPKDDNNQAVNIEMNQHVSVPCSFKYLVNFSKRVANKCGPLSFQVWRRVDGMH